MRKEKGYIIRKDGNNESFSPIFNNKEMNIKLDIYCGITNKNKTRYCEEVILEALEKDIKQIQGKLKGE